MKKIGQIFFRGYGSAGNPDVGAVFRHGGLPDVLHSREKKDISVRCLHHRELRIAKKNSSVCFRGGRQRDKVNFLIRKFAFFGSKGRKFFWKKGSRTVQTQEQARDLQVKRIVPALRSQVFLENPKGEKLPEKGLHILPKLRTGALRHFIIPGQMVGQFFEIGGVLQRIPEEGAGLIQNHCFVLVGHLLTKGEKIPGITYELLRCKAAPAIL